MDGPMPSTTESSTGADGRSASERSTTEQQTSGGRRAKSAGAFRTISEVADELDVAQHVLRFWESKFPQVRPLKRGGGRRYYRPEDVDLLRRIRSLLYDEGYTIKGAQKLLKGQRRGTIERTASRGNGSRETQKAKDQAAEPAVEKSADIEAEPALRDLAQDKKLALEAISTNLKQLRDKLRKLTT